MTSSQPPSTPTSTARPFRHALALVVGGVHGVAAGRRLAGWSWQVELFEDTLARLGAEWLALYALLIVLTIELGVTVLCLRSLVAREASSDAAPSFDLATTLAILYVLPLAYVDQQLEDVDRLADHLAYGAFVLLSRIGWRAC